MQTGFLLSLGGDEIIYATRFDRIRRLALDGEPVDDFGRLGVAPSRLLMPGRVASDGNRALVVDDGAIKVYALSGAGADFQYALGEVLTALPANHTPRTPHTDLALDAKGRLYVGAEQHIAIFDQEYRRLGDVALDGVLRLAVGDGDWLYAIRGAGQGAAVIALRRAPDWDPAPGEALPRLTEEARRVAVAAPETLVTPWRRGSGRTVGASGSVGHVSALAADPSAPGVLWLATGQGLMRWSPTEAARLWTAADGLPPGLSSALWIDAQARYVWVGTRGGLARLPLDTLDAGIETVGTGEPSGSYASAFLGRTRDGKAVWFWNDAGLYRIRVEDSETQHYRFAEPLRGVVRRGDRFLVHDGRRLWQFDPDAGELTLLVTVDALLDVTAVGPPGLPEMRELALDPARAELWIGTQGHGVYQYDLESGLVRRPAFLEEPHADCGRPDGRAEGRVVISGGHRYLRWGACWGRLADAGPLALVQDRVTAGPVTLADGAVWYAVQDALVSSDASGRERHPLR
jgi:hypothetical protein